MEYMMHWLKESWGWGRGWDGVWEINKDVYRYIQNYWS
jgi:hypothetical protein